MAITAFSTVSTALSIGTETFINVNEAGVFTFHVDMTLLQDGDVLQIREYQMPVTGGTAVVVNFEAYYGARSAYDAAYHSEAYSNDLAETNALRFSLTQTHGTGRAIPRKVLKHA